MPARRTTWIRTADGWPPVLQFQRRYSANDQPLAIVTAYLPADLAADAVEPLLSAVSATETTYTMWELARPKPFVSADSRDDLVGELHIVGLQIFDAPRVR
jgi:hypothetical protein